MRFTKRPPTWLGATALAAVCAATLALADSDTAQPLVLDLETAVTLALEQHPEMLEQRERRAELRALRGQAVARALPKLEANASSTRSRDPGLLNSPNFRQLGEGDPGGGGEFPFDPSFLQPIPITSYNYNVSVEQTVYSFGRIGAAIETARIRERQLETEILAAETTVARRAVIALYGLSLAESRLEVLAAERKARERQLEQAEDFLEIGTGTRLQVLQAKSALTALRPRELSARGDIESARAKLNEALGRPSLAEVDAAPGLLDVALPALTPVQELLPGVNDRADLAALRIQRSALEEESKVWHSNVLPDITFNGSYGISTIFTDELTNTDFASWSVGLSLGWTFFDGYETRHKVREIRSQQTQNEHREATMRAQYERDLVSFAAEYRRAREAVDAARESVGEAEETLRVAEESYAWGAATSLDVLNGQQALTAARFELLSATHDALVAQTEIRSLTGQRPAALSAPEEQK